MLATAVGDHHKHLTGTGAGTARWLEHLVTDYVESGRKVICCAVPIFYLMYGPVEGYSVSVAVEVEFDARTIVKRHHAYLRLVRPDHESPGDVCHRS